MKGLQQFIAFAETAKHGSFAAAARELGCASSALSKAVVRLENGLDVKLFHRTTRQVRLTPDGERLFERCQRLLADVENLKADAAGVRSAPSGTLRVSVPIVYGRRVLLPLFAKLVTQHPQLTLDLRLQDDYVDLVKEGIDIAVRVGELDDSSLVARRFSSQHLVLCASPAYLAEQGRPERLDDLTRHAAIVFRVPSTGRDRPWQFAASATSSVAPARRARLVEVQPLARMQVNDGEGMVGAACLGLGLTQVPHYMVSDEIADGRLIEVLAEHRPPPMPISAIYPGARLVPARVRALLDLLDTSGDNYLPPAPQSPRRPARR